MRKGWHRTLATVAATGVVAAVAAAPAASASGAPLRFTFTKTCTIGVPISVCSGSAAGDVSGPLTAVEQPGTWWSGGIGHVTFVEHVGGDTMLVTGILDTHTLSIVMNGRVIDGPNKGARTHHLAQIVAFAGANGELAVIEGAGFVLPQTGG